MPLCECQLRDCCRVIDPLSGRRGVLLDARTFRKHQMDDAENSRKALLHEQVAKAQRQALQAQHNQIEEALSQMSISSSSQAHLPTNDPKYKVDFKRKLLNHVNQWEQRLSQLAKDAELLGIAPPSASLHEINVALLECKRIHFSCGEIENLFRIASEGRLRKEPSVKSVLSNFQNLFGDVSRAISVVTTSWEDLSTVHENRQRDLLLAGATIFDSGKHFESFLGDAPIIVQLVSFMVVVAHVIMGFSRRSCAWLFSMTAFIVETVINQAGVNGTVGRILMNIAKGFPSDIRGAVDSFHLDGAFTIYAVCPKCHEVYKPGFVNGIPVYPQRCNAKRYNNRCGELVVRPKRIGKQDIFVPIKPYVVYDFPDWLSGLMARVGYEQEMDQAWERMSSNCRNMEDIFQGSIIRNFKGPDGRTHFCQAGPDKDTGRYLFSMGFDFFNPHRNLANGKRVSVGVIAFVCLNLPISMRYKPENIFLGGIIPGPREPSLSFINPYLRPFVDFFLQLWKGIRFSRTCMYESGRWVLCALIAIICDLPAARKAGGFAAASHEYFCSLCWCNKTEHGYSNYDYESWIRRTPESCRDWANKFRNAPSEKLAQSSFDRSGVRYSVLLDLPYYDPAKHLIVDPMHNLFLGLIKEHFQGILGYVPKGSSANDPVLGPKVVLDFTITASACNPIPTEPRERASVRKMMNYLRGPLEVDSVTSTSAKSVINSWANVHLCALVYVAKALRCIPATVSPDGHDYTLTTLPFNSGKLTRKDIATRLLNWRIQQEHARIHSSHGDTADGILPGNVFTDDEIHNLWGDIEDMIKPSWATSVPSNISSVGAKLKSDQWRSVGTLFLPVTLVRMWSACSEGPNGTSNGQRRELLHLTMLLCSAICVISSRSVSETQAQLYLCYMVQYRKELQRLFPRYRLHPNHHMALHIQDFILMYGPIHGWWTFPFERMIGQLQRIHVNYKPGEYEQTISQSWTRSSNFRALFSRSTCPKAIRFCAVMFERLTRPGNNNNMAELHIESNMQDEADNDNIGTSSKPLPMDVLHALKTAAHPWAAIPQSAATRGRITVQGVSYTALAVHEGNSGVLCFGSDTPFCTLNILEFPDGTLSEQYWFVVRRHKAAMIMSDPYAAYPHLRARLWDKELEEGVEVIPLSRIETHFAKCHVSWEEKELVVVVSLSKTHVI